MSPECNHTYPYKRDTQRRRHIDWKRGDNLTPGQRLKAVTSQGMWTDTRSCRKQVQVLPWGRQRECEFAKTLISDSWSLELRDSTFLLFKALGNEYNVEHHLPALRFLELPSPHSDHVLPEGRAPDLPS